MSLGSTHELPTLAHCKSEPENIGAKDACETPLNSIGLSARYASMIATAAPMLP